MRRLFSTPVQIWIDGTRAWRQHSVPSRTAGKVGIRAGSVATRSGFEERKKTLSLLRILQLTLHARWYDLMFTFFYHGHIRRTAKWRYREHVAMVQGMCRSQGRQILEWSVADGWQPLCKFLEKPIPDHDFPSGNASPELMKRVGEIQQRQGEIANRNAALTATVSVGFVAVLVYTLRTY